MRNAPTNWNTLMSQQHQTETRVDIDNGSGGVTSFYGYDGNGGIWSLATRNALFENFGAGNCHSGQIDLTLVPQTAHWWRKSSIAYTWIDGGEPETWYAAETYRLYKHMKAINEYLDVGCDGDDYIDATPEQVMAAVQQGYMFHYDPANGVKKVLDIFLDGDEWMERYELYWGATEERYDDDYIAIEGLFISNESGAEGAHPAYGEAGGYWWEYTGERASTIPPMAKMEVYVRLTNGTLTTDWVRKGVYFIDTREWDAQHEFLTITGYDAMLKAEQPYYKPPVYITGWPKVDTAVVEEICTRLGVTLDTRTVLNKGYMVQLPAVSTDGEGSDSLRTTLGYIGAAYGGNWIITDEGELRLVPLKSTATPIELGTNGIDLQTFPAYDALGIVHVVVSEDAEYTAGTDGRDIEISCPWGTQTMANNLLTALQDYVYQPLTITTEYAADPLYELGDNISFNGYTSVIADETINFSLAYTADFAAPNGEEIEHEYPYQGKEQQEIKRIVARSTASLKVDIDRIEGKVDGKITTYRQATVPTDANTGDLWYATADVGDYKADTWYRYNGSTWDETSAAVPVAPAWETAHNYKKGDIVDEGGKWYAAKLTHTSADGNKPPNDTYWEERETISAITSSQILQTIDGITLSVTTGQNGSVINMTSGDIRIQSQATFFETDEAHFSGSLSANKISAGSIDADVVSVRDAFAVQMKIDNVWTTVGYVGAGTGSDGQTITRGAVLKSADGNSYAIATNAGIRITSDDTSFYCTPDAIGYRLNGGPAIPFGQGEIAKFG